MAVTIIPNPLVAVQILASPELALAMELVGDAALEIVQQDVPVDTGELRDSLYVERIGPGRRIGASADHAMPVEFGTSDMAAQPFLRPALSKLGIRRVQ
jgi:hypothetical protein